MVKYLHPLRIFLINKTEKKVKSIKRKVKYLMRAWELVEHFDEPAMNRQAG